MNLTPSALAAIYYSFHLEFQTAYERAVIWNDKFCSTLTSTGKSERHAWMKRLPAFRKWVGERYFNNVVARETEIINETWEDSYELSVEDIKDDKIGVFAQHMKALGEQAKLWPDHLMAPIIQGGKTATCFDGQFFFDTDHPYDMDRPGLGTYANLFTGAPLAAETLSEVRASMVSVLGDDGKPLGVNPKLIIVPPQLRDRAAQICNAEFIAPAAAFGQNAAGGYQSNVLKGAYEYLEVPQFANEPTTWYIADVSKPIRPFVFQLREAPDFVSVVDPNSPAVFERRVFQFGSSARGGGAGSLPFLVSRCEA